MTSSGPARGRAAAAAAGIGRKKRPSPFPRVSTRGSYDLHTGVSLRRAGSPQYRVYPRRYLDALVTKAAREVVVVMHGLRNDGAGALAKFVTARRRLRRIGYVHPVVGYSYDSNTRGAHLERSALRALRVGQRIARYNGRHLARFVLDVREASPDTRIRLVGHSLGTEVILHAADALARGRRGRGAVESVHFFGGSVTAADLRSVRYGGALRAAVASRVVNYYSPGDGVLAEAHESGAVHNPVGYAGCAVSWPGGGPRYVQRRVWPRNHRFASYAAVMRSFP